MARMLLQLLLLLSTQQSCYGGGKKHLLSAMQRRRASNFAGEQHRHAQLADSLQGKAGPCGSSHGSSCGSGDADDRPPASKGSSKKRNRLHSRGSASLEPGDHEQPSVPHFLQTINLDPISDQRAAPDSQDRLVALIHGHLFYQSSGTSNGPGRNGVHLGHWMPLLGFWFGDSGSERQAEALYEEHPADAREVLAEALKIDYEGFFEPGWVKRNHAQGLRELCTEEDWPGMGFGFGGGKNACACLVLAAKRSYMIKPKAPLHGQLWHDACAWAREIDPDISPGCPGANGESDYPRSYNYFSFLFRMVGCNPALGDCQRQRDFNLFVELTLNRDNPALTSIVTPTLNDFQEIAHAYIMRKADSDPTFAGMIAHLHGLQVPTEGVPAIGIHDAVALNDWVRDSSANQGLPSPSPWYNDPHLAQEFERTMQIFEKQCTADALAMLPKTVQDTVNSRRRDHRTIEDLRGVMEEERRLNE